MTTEKKQIVGWAVCYVPNHEGRTYAGLKTETIEWFKNQDSAIEHSNHLNMAGSIDELHVGYRAYPMHWIPKNVTLK